MHAYIIQQLIRIILFIIIGLPIGLKVLPKKQNVSIWNWTLPAMEPKQDKSLELKYISTADFDSVSPPDFGTLIETVEGATPHKVVIQ